VLNKQLDKNIVHQDTNRNQQEITEQLHPSMQGGIMKYHIAHQEKARWKANGKSNDKSHDVRADGDKAQINHLLVQYKIVADEKYHDIKDRIATAAGDVPKSLDWDEFPERRIKKVDYGGHQVGHSANLPAKLAKSCLASKQRITVNFLLVNV
jgi:hypothetical protein